MATPRFAWRTMLTAALLVGAGVLAPATAAHAAPTGATFTKTYDWGTGYQGQYTISNGGTSAISGWRVEFDLAAGTSVGAYWDSLMTQSGSHYTFTNREYNGTIQPGASVTFGFVGYGTGTPTNCRLNGGSCTGVSDTQPPSVPANLAVSGVTSSSASLTWSASTDNTGVAGYRVFTGSTLATTVTGTAATVTGLAPSTTYSFTVRAFDAAGNLSAASAAVSATTSSGPPDPGPGTHLAPYVDMGSWPTPVLSDMTAASGVKSFTAAFITSYGCKASWFGAYDPRAGWAKDQFDGVRARGGTVKFSFGGASGIELAQACGDAASTATEYNAVVNAYGATYLDFDIEGAAVADPATVARRSQAIAQVQRAHPGLKVSLTLPVLPEGLTADGLGVVRSAINAGVDLDVVNGMAMDYYRGNIDMGAAANQVAQSLYNQLRPLYPNKTTSQVWSMVGVTPMLGVNDDNSTFSLANARTLVDTSAQRHVGFLSFWEMTRDRNACTGALYRCTNIPQQPYDFSKIFAPYNG